MMKTRETYRALFLSLGWSVVAVNVSIDTYYCLSGIASLEPDGLIQAIPPAFESARGFVVKRFGRKPKEPKVVAPEGQRTAGDHTGADSGQQEHYPAWMIILWNKLSTRSFDTKP